MSAMKLQSKYYDWLRFNKDALKVLIPLVLHDSNYLVRSSVLALLLGILLILTLSSLYILARKDIKPTSIRLLFLSTISLFASTATFYGFIISTIRDSNNVAVGPPKGPNSPTYPIDHNHLQNALYSVTAATLAANMLISDGIVYWRVIVIWGGNVIVKSLCGSFMAATLGFGVATVYHPHHRYIRQGPSDAVGYFDSEFAGIVCMIVSLGGNVICTMLVAYKTWVHWNIVKNLHRTMGAPFLNSQALSILLVVVESGAMYCVLWIFVVIGSGETYSSHKGVVFSWLEMGTILLVSWWLIPLVAIYPMLIIVIVALKKSPIDRMHGQISSLVVRDNEGGAGVSTLALPVSEAASDPTPNHDIELSVIVGIAGDMHGMDGTRGER